MKISLKAFAKVNWTLDILGRREDGYHVLETVMQSVDLADEVILEKREIDDKRRSIDKGSTHTPKEEQTSIGSVDFTMEDHGANMSFLPPKEQNLAYKAAKIFCQELDKKKKSAKIQAIQRISAMPKAFLQREGEAAEGIFEQEKDKETRALFDIKIHVNKKIPSQAGLGGGSADAAAVLHGMNQLCGQAFSDPELRAMGLKLGADIPFCLMGGACLAQGIGEVLTPFEAKEFALLMVKPEGGASTAEIYAAYDEDIESAATRCAMQEDKARDLRPYLDFTKGNAVQSEVITALQEGDPRSLAEAMANALYPASARLHPAIRQAKEVLEAQEGCLRAMMTGSGSAIIGLFDSEKQLQKAKRQCEEAGLRSWVLHTVKQGIEEILEGEVLS